MLTNEFMCFGNINKPVFAKCYARNQTALTSAVNGLSWQTELLRDPRNKFVGTTIDDDWHCHSPLLIMPLSQGKRKA